MLTQFGGANFAISYFDIGTLLFMQEQAHPEQKRRESILCMTSNVRYLSMSTFALLSFHEELTDIKNPDTKISALQKTVEGRLAELPKRYNNALCRTWYQNYRRLSPFVKKQ
jgi:predicted translin family RNA/ssDNA-binding protein